MPTKRSKPTRKPRADAQRNRQRILEVAKQAFTLSGADSSLDDIAKQAGVGPGTLYRHFPARDVLLEEVGGRGAEVSCGPASAGSPPSLDVAVC